MKKTLSAMVAGLVLSQSAFAVSFGGYDVSKNVISAAGEHLSGLSALSSENSASAKGARANQIKKLEELANTVLTEQWERSIAENVFGIYSDLKKAASLNAAGNTAELKDLADSYLLFN